MIQTLELQIEYIIFHQLKIQNKKILKSLKNWSKEAGGYVWDDKAGDERPVKVADHLMDSMRYFVKTKRIAAKHRQYPI